MAETNDGAVGTMWWSKAILIGAVVAAALLPVGALGTRVGIWTFGTGFLLLAAATVLAAIGLVTGIAGIIAAHRRKLRDDRQAVYLGTIVSALVLALMGQQFYAASSVPPIHNISTDVADPPQFDAVVALRGENSNPLEYNADEIAAEQLEAYPWVETLASDLPPDAALQRAVQVLEEMGLEIVNVDAQAGRVEATDTTRWFGFKDDVVVRVRPGPTGSVVDMRSVSRVGVSDLGANAQRIGEFLEAFPSA
ncbi:MAG: hypothetical protein CMQ43_02375 [Gammaproteobacteria bacterium]|nr:hypothetical protein [Gammaproteobacteria bacterium]